MIVQTKKKAASKAKILVKKERNNGLNLPRKSQMNKDYISRKKYSIFCVDDSHQIQFIVKSFLSQGDYQVTGNTDAFQSFMMLLKMKQVDIIVMDIMMPGMGGYKLLKLIKNTDKLKDIPVIMLTSRTRKFDRIRAKLLGAVGYITKPFRDETLITMLDLVILSKRKLEV